MQHGVDKSDMRQSLFLNPTCDIGESVRQGQNKRQGHAALPFLKIDMHHWEPPLRAPILPLH